MKYRIMCNKCEGDDFSNFWEGVRFSSIDENKEYKLFKQEWDIQCNLCGAKMFFKDADIGEINK